MSFRVPSLFLLLFFVTAAVCNAQTVSTGEVAKATTNSETKSEAPAAPAFNEYKGVRIGMMVNDVRDNLERYLKVKGDAQDFLVLSDGESAQVFYDSGGKVKAVSVDYVFKKGNAPTLRDVLGLEVQANPDGSLYARKQYPEAGYWVSYNRTSGDNPIVTVTMQALK